MLLNVSEIEAHARQLKIVARNGKVLVEDGAITDGFIDVPLASGLRLHVLKNTAGGGAELKISRSSVRNLSDLSSDRLRVWKKGTAYYDGSTFSNPALKAV